MDINIDIYFHYAILRCTGHAIVIIVHYYLDAPLLFRLALEMFDKYDAVEIDLEELREEFLYRVSTLTLLLHHYE